VNQHVQFPANSLLITAMNPSPSGYFADDALGRCCQLQNYLIITKLNENLQSCLRIGFWFNFLQFLMLLSLLNQRRLNG
jgi:magnesium chelatase family protein